MMRGVSTWAVAVRKPSAEQLAAGGPSSKEGARGEIDVLSEPLVSWTKRHRLLRIPLVRGVVALAESLKIGFRALGISANAQVPGDEDGDSREIGGGAWFGTIAFALLFAIGLFFLLPAGLTQLFKDDIPNGIVFVLIEMIVAIFVFAPLGKLDLQWLLLSRVLGIPIVAGLAFEVIKWFGRNRTKRWARLLMWPGIQLQRLTTREPDLSQLAVAIAALDAVLAVENPREASADETVGMEVVA